MKSLRRVFLVPGLATIALLLLIILVSTQPALVQETTPGSGSALTGNGRSLSITGLSSPSATGHATAAPSNQILAPTALVNDGSFEKLPSDWLENASTNCGPWINDWSATLGISAYHGARYFWAGGACGPPGQTPAPNSNSNVLLKLGAANDPIGGVGNVLFDFVEFLDPVPVVSLIDPETGGTLTYANPDGLPTIITVPPGAVTDTIALVYTPRSGPGHPLGNLQFANQAFDLDALEHFLYLPSVLREPAPGDRQVAVNDNVTTTSAGSLSPTIASYTFLEPVTIIINYSDANVPGAESDLRLYYWTGRDWQDAVTTCSPQSQYEINETLNTVTLSICHLSRFSVVGAG